MVVVLSYHDGPQRGTMLIPYFRDIEMTTETIIIDAGKFGLDGLLKQAMKLAYWLAEQGAAYNTEVDHDCNLHIEMDADIAVHFKLMWHDIMVTQEKLDQRSDYAELQMAAQRDLLMQAQQQYMAALNVQHSLATPFYNNIQQAVAKLGGTP